MGSLGTPIGRLEGSRGVSCRGDGTTPPEASVSLIGAFASLADRSHELRAVLSEEMHLRAWPALAAPASMIQFLMLASQEELDEGRRRLPDADGEGPAGSTNTRFLRGDLDELTWFWERQTEFATLSFVSVKSGQAPFDLSPFAVAAAVAEAMPGRILRSTNLCMIGGDASEALAAASFAPQDLVVSDVARGAARIWSDFRLHSDGFGRLLIRAYGLSPNDGSQLVQRVQELGNYRKMALLGLPVARIGTMKLDQLERDLTLITERLAEPGCEMDEVLEDVSQLSSALAQIVARSRFRMAASKAYADFAIDRIRALDVSAVTDARSFDDFTERRLVPAMRTCDAFTRRMDDLIQRADWINGLLRTRVDTAIARRNRDLLDSMDQRTALQLRLQQAVEGLSIVAISYYAIAIGEHALDAARRSGAVITELMDVALIPIAIAVTWLCIRRVRRHVLPLK